MTPPPDLLPWNATGCCAGNKKRQRLKLQGATLLGPGDSSAAAPRRKKKHVLRLSICTLWRCLGISHITPPPPLPPSLPLSIPLLVPVRIHICSTAAQDTESSHEFQDRNRSRGGGSLCYPRLCISSSLVLHMTTGGRKIANSAFHINSGKLLSTSCPALVLLVFRRRKTGGCSTVLSCFLPKLTETKLMNIVEGLKKYVLPGNISDLCHRFKGSASIP